MDIDPLVPTPVLSFVTFISVTVVRTYVVGVVIYSTSVHVYGHKE